MLCLLWLTVVMPFVGWASLPETGGRRLSLCLSLVSYPADVVRQTVVGVCSLLWLTGSGPGTMVLCSSVTCHVTCRFNLGDSDHVPHSSVPVGVPVSSFVRLSPVLYLSCSSDIPDFPRSPFSLYYSDYSMIGLLSVVLSRITHTYLQGAPHLFRI